MDFSDKLKSARKNAGLTQAQLAKKLGVTVQNYSQYETGKRNPKYETRQRILKAIGIDINELEPPTQEELERMRENARNADSERIEATEEERLSSLINHKAKMLDNSGKQKVVDYMDDLTKIPDYRKEPKDPKE